MRDLEHIEQCRCVKWFRLQYPKIATDLIAIPNGGRRDAVTGARLKAEGVVAGVADLFLEQAFGGFFGLRIEMKTAEGRQSPAQKAYEQRCSANGYLYVVCRSLAQFQTIINDYLSKPPTSRTIAV